VFTSHTLNINFQVERDPKTYYIKDLFLLAFLHLQKKKKCLQKGKREHT